MAVKMTRGRRLLGRFNLLSSALLAFLIWVAVTALATRPTFKALIDLSPQARFTISEDTRALLADLAAAGDAALRIDTFYGRLPSPRTAAEQHAITIHRRIQELTDDLLLRLAELGGDRVEVRHYDVMGDVAATRSRVEELGGLSQDDVVVVSIGRRHKELSLSLDLAEIDFPAARNAAVPGSAQMLPTFKVYKGEEAIASAARTLLVEGTPRVYFLSGYLADNLTQGVADSYSELMSALRRDGFEVGLLDLEREGRIPDDAAVLAVLEPRAEISPQAATVLYRWLRQGGRLVLDLSWSEVDGPNWNPSWDELGRLVGFRVGADLVCHLVPDPALPQAPGVGGIAARRVAATGVSAQHPITRPLAQRNRTPILEFAREVTAAGVSPEGTTFEPLLRSGPYAWLAPRDPRSEDAVYTQPAERERYAERNLAAIVDLRPESGERRGHVVVLGGMAFVNSRMQFNGDLALNMFNWLAQRAALVTVRGNRYRAARIELAPQQIERTGALLRYLVPGGLLTLGLLVLWIRRRG
jgi:hypothetical protein